jgi:hypothetical protein
MGPSLTPGLATLSLNQGVTAHGGPSGPLQFDRLEAILGRQYPNSNSNSISPIFALRPNAIRALPCNGRADKRAKSVAAKPL